MIIWNRNIYVHNQLPFPSPSRTDTHKKHKDSEARGEEKEKQHTAFSSTIFTFNWKGKKKRRDLKQLKYEDASWIHMDRADKRMNLIARTQNFLQFRFGPPPQT